MKAIDYKKEYERLRTLVDGGMRQNMRLKQELAEAQRTIQEQKKRIGDLMSAGAAP